MIRLSGYLTQFVSKCLLLSSNPFELPSSRLWYLGVKATLIISDRFSAEMYSFASARLRLSNQSFTRRVFVCFWLQGIECPQKVIPPSAPKYCRKCEFARQAQLFLFVPKLPFLEAPERITAYFLQSALKQDLVASKAFFRLR